MVDTLINILGYVILAALSISGLIFFGLVFFIIVGGIIGLIKDDPLEVFTGVLGFIFFSLLFYMLWQSDFYYSS